MPQAVLDVFWRSRVRPPARGLDVALFLDLALDLADLREQFARAGKRTLSQLSRCHVAHRARACHCTDGDRDGKLTLDEVMLVVARTQKGPMGASSCVVC